MRVVICLQHNMLMEPSRPESLYLVCAKCKEFKHLTGGYYPEWFPIELAMRNHQDGATKRTWRAVRSRWSRSQWTWERVKEEDDDSTDRVGREDTSDGQGR